MLNGQEDTPTGEIHLRNPKIMEDKDDQAKYSPTGLSSSTHCYVLRHLFSVSMYEIQLQLPSLLNSFMPQAKWQFYRWQKIFLLREAIYWSPNTSMFINFIGWIFSLNSSISQINRSGISRLQCDHHLLLASCSLKFQCKQMQSRKNPNLLSLIHSIPILQKLLNNICIWGNMNLKS